MGLKVFLCEKPDQGKNIAAVISKGRGRMKNGFIDCGDDVVVTWAIGHILEQADPEDYDEALKRRENIEPLPIFPSKWKLRIVNDKKSQFNNIRALIVKADEVVIASDAGREGELIGREILEKCDFKRKVSRLWLQALNKQSIEAGLASIMPGEKTFGLYMAGLARSRADWLIGMNMSRIMTAAYGEPNKGGYASSIPVGRIQSPTLAIVVARDALIDGFVEKSFFNLTAVFKHTNGLIQSSYVLPADAVDAAGHCVDKALLSSVANKINGASGVVTSSETEQKKEYAPLPYDLSTLQQEASKRLKITVKKVLDIAQVLYEKHKIISYPRVDSRYLVESMFKDVPAIVASLVAMDGSVADVVSKVDLSLMGRAWNTKQVEKSDHHAMMPLAVDGSFDLSVLTAQERAVYLMIRDRFLMQFSNPYEFDATKLLIECAGESFVATGKAVRFLGWKGLFDVPDDAGKSTKNGAGAAEVKLPLVEQGDAVVMSESNITDGKTKPPARFTEGTLLAAMENVASLVEDPKMKQILGASGGLGTPATRAATIDGLKEKGLLVEQTGRNPHLLSSARGRMIVQKLPPELTSPKTTAVWEIALAQIEKGTISYDDFMSKQQEFISKLVAMGKDVAGKRQDIRRSADAV